MALQLAIIGLKGRRTTGLFWWARRRPWLSWGVLGGHRGIGGRVWVIPTHFRGVWICNRIPRMLSVSSSPALREGTLITPFASGQRKGPKYSPGAEFDFPGARGAMRGPVCRWNRRCERIPKLPRPSGLTRGDESTGYRQQGPSLRRFMGRIQSKKTIETVGLLR